MAYGTIKVETHGKVGCHNAQPSEGAERAQYRTDE